MLDKPISGIVRRTSAGRRRAVKDCFISFFSSLGHIRRSTYVAVLFFAGHSSVTLVLYHYSNYPLVYFSIVSVFLYRNSPNNVDFIWSVDSFTMFTFSKATSKSQPRPSLRFRTFNGWTGTIERERAVGAPSPPAKPRKTISWLHRHNNSPIQRVERPVTPFMQSISPPLPLNYYAPLPLVVGPISSRPAETTLPVYGKDHPGLPFNCTKVVLVASTDPSRPYRIRRINTRKELPWSPISKPLPPLPPPPASPAPQTSLDDGLDDLSIFLRRIAYDVISATTIHRHLGYMEDGGRVLPLSRTRRSVRRRINPPKRYSSLMGVSLAIMEGRLPKALMVM